MSNKNLLQILNEDQALAAEEESLKSRIAEVQARRKALASASEAEIRRLKLDRDPGISTSAHPQLVVEVDGALIVVTKSTNAATPQLSFLNVQKL